MKLRLGFISNSSSSSFVLDKRYLTPEQVTSILEWEGTADDIWHIVDEENEINCCSNMDNGGFGKFLKELNIGLKAIQGEIIL